jgi:hypothetical protein
LVFLFSFFHFLLRNVFDISMCFPLTSYWMLSSSSQAQSSAAHLLETAAKTSMASAFCPIKERAVLAMCDALSPASLICFW